MASTNQGRQQPPNPKPSHPGYAYEYKQQLKGVIYYRSRHDEEEQQVLEQQAQKQQQQRVEDVQRRVEDVQQRVEDVQQRVEDVQQRVEDVQQTQIGTNRATENSKNLGGTNSSSMQNNSISMPNSGNSMPQNGGSSSSTFLNDGTLIGNWEGWEWQEKKKKHKYRNIPRCPIGPMFGNRLVPVETEEDRQSGLTQSSGPVYGIDDDDLGTMESTTSSARNAFNRFVGLNNAVEEEDREFRWSETDSLDASSQSIFSDLSAQRYRPVPLPLQSGGNSRPNPNLARDTSPMHWTDPESEASAVEDELLSSALAPPSSGLMPSDPSGRETGSTPSAAVQLPQAFHASNVPEEEEEAIVAAVPRAREQQRRAGREQVARKPAILPYHISDSEEDEEEENGANAMPPRARAVQQQKQQQQQHVLGVPVPPPTDPVPLIARQRNPLDANVHQQQRQRRRPGSQLSMTGSSSYFSVSSDPQVAQFVERLAGDGVEANGTARANAVPAYRPNPLEEFSLELEEEENGQQPPATPTPPAGSTSSDRAVQRNMTANSNSCLSSSTSTLQPNILPNVVVPSHPLLLANEREAFQQLARRLALGFKYRPEEGAIAFSQPGTGRILVLNAALVQEGEPEVEGIRISLHSNGRVWRETHLLPVEKWLGQATVEGLCRKFFFDHPEEGAEAQPF